MEQLEPQKTNCSGAQEELTGCIRLEATETRCTESFENILSIHLVKPNAVSEKPEEVGELDILEGSTQMVTAIEKETLNFVEVEPKATGSLTVPEFMDSRKLGEVSEKLTMDLVKPNAESEKLGEAAEHTMNLDIDIPNEEPEDNTEPTCRFCYGPASPSRPLFFPCKCSGTMQHIHQDCLVTWILRSNKHTCSTCSFRFQFQKIYSPDLPESIGIKTILSTLFSPITNALSRLPPVLADILEFIFIYLCVPFFTVTRFRRHLYTDSDWLDFLLELISPYGVFGDMFFGFFYLFSILYIGCLAVTFQWKSTHGGRLPEWINPQDPIAGFRIAVSVTKRFFGMEEEDLVEVILDPENSPRHQDFRPYFWNLTLKGKLIYIYFFYPFTRIPTQCLLPIVTSIVFVLIFEYSPLRIGEYLVGNLEFGWLKYWIQLYLGYIPLTFALWFIRSCWQDQRIRNKLEYAHSCMRVLLLKVFVHLFHPLLISFLLDLSLNNLVHSGNPENEERRNFFDYTLWELFLYYHIAMICISTVYKLFEPILTTSITPIEETSLSIHKLTLRLANKIWTVSCIFLLFWMQTYFLNIYFPKSLERSNNASLTWSEKLNYLCLGTLAQSFKTRTSASLHRLITKLHNKTLRSIWVTSLIILSISLELIIGPIFIGRIFGNLVLDKGELSDCQNAINGVVVLWMLYLITSKSSEIVSSEGFTKFEKLNKITAMVSKYTISVILLLGVVPFLLGLTLKKYLFQPIGSEIGLDCWTTGIFLIQLVVIIVSQSPWVLNRMRPTLYMILINGPYVPLTVCSLILYLLIAVCVPYLFSQAIWIILWIFGYGYVRNFSIESVVYSGFILIPFLIGLCFVGIKLIEMGSEYVKSKHLVGDYLLNFQQNNLKQQTAPESIA